MDLWVFGAAAAAGCIAKYCRNLSADREFGKPEIPRCLARRLIQKNKKQEEDTDGDVRNDSNEIFSDTYWVDDDLEPESVSSCGYNESIGSSRNDEDFNLLYLSSLPSDVSTDESFEHNEASSHKFRYHILVSGKNKIALRSDHSHGNFNRPLSSLESCLMAHFYKEKEKVQYVFCSPVSPRKSMMTNGSQAIGRVNCDSFSERVIINDNKLDRRENICGIPSLPQLETAKRRKSKRGKGHLERLSSELKMGSGKYFDSQNGTHNTMALFCVGICIGVISSIVANKKEMEKLKDVLKQTENLVQDLQEELEMKDSFTVKELSSGNYESRENSFRIQDANPHFSENGRTELYNEKVNDSSESMSKIEAELEAELERLGLNMNTSFMERHVSDLVEVDPDFEPVFARGELRPEKLKWRGVEMDSNQDASDTPTNHCGNYSVSPRALSLRLHEVIQSRLEERVMELEIALQYSQRKLQHLESERKNVLTGFSGTELRYSSSDEESPICRNDCHPSTLHSPGEPLHIYEEVRKGYSQLFDKRVSRNQNGSTNVSLQQFPQDKASELKESYCSELMTKEEQGSGVGELQTNETSEEEGSYRDEMEQELIKQIIEKTKRGSPAVIHAQRVLFSMDR